MKEFRPTSPGVRQMTILDFAEITAVEPEKSLTRIRLRKGGRNNTGRITAKYRGGGAKRLYRQIDFKRDKIGIAGKVVTIEYDPNRTANIALVHYKDGEKRYILAPVDLHVGDTIIASHEAEIRAGNSLPIANIPVGSLMHNLEVKPGKGGQMVRSAGMSAQLIGKEETYANIRLPSGELRKILLTCRATIGQVGNLAHENIVWGKAGRVRHLGIRPTVRATAMNPVDHPHGGGEGRTKGGRHPVNVRGFPCKGKKTRRNPRTDQFILKRREK